MKLKFGFKRENIFAKTEGGRNRLYREISKEMYGHILNEMNLSEGLFEDEEKMVFSAIKLIEKELKSLGLKNPIEDKSDYLGVLSHVFFTTDHDGDLKAVFNERMRVIEVYRNENISDLETFVSILHELLHFFAITKIYERKTEKGYKIFIRTGYAEGDTFDLFNEAITEELSMELLKKQEEIRIGDTLFSKEEIEKYVNESQVYISAREMLKEIIQYTAEKTKLSREDMWKKIKIGYFRGDMMFLRIFERAYGDGFLRTLADIEKYILKYELNAFDLKKIFKDRNSFLSFMEMIRKKENEFPPLSFF